MATKPPASQRKITVTLPTILLKQLDEIVPSRKRSEFIQDAVAHRLALALQQQAIEEMDGLWSDEDYPHLATDEDIDSFIADLRSGATRTFDELSS